MRMRSWSLAKDIEPMLWWAFMSGLLCNYEVFELTATGRDSPLPSAPTDRQKYSYVDRNLGPLMLASCLGFGCVTLSTLSLLIEHAWLMPLLLLLAYTVVYFAVSQVIYFVSSDFDLKSHRWLVGSWRPDQYPSVDVFLPTCGEPLDVLANTWAGVRQMRKCYPGEVNVYCLDDAHSDEVRRLAVRFGFTCLARPDRGRMKKAGNLRYGFSHSRGDFIAIFDADFRPRHDFLTELLPYFDQDKRLGIVQSPQFFDALARQNWIERGAGAVQELFYRAVQVSRQASGGAICVGSNAIYRRAALNDIGGTALIEHSEDVHTGFNLRMKGWRLKYVPVVLAKGLCPSELEAFFKQQYRWCMGSMSLLTSAKFWRTRLPLMTRLCYLSGFMYYIHTAVYALLMPVVPLVMLYVLPDQVRLVNYLLILPSVFYVHVVFPLWHRAPYGIEVASVKNVYGWAHLQAIVDKIRDKAMEWQPTGATSRQKQRNYQSFRRNVVLFNLIPAILWVAGAAYHMTVSVQPLHYLPILLLGVYYFFTILKVVAYQDAKPAEVPAASMPALPQKRGLWGLRRPGAAASVLVLSQALRVQGSVPAE